MKFIIGILVGILALFTYQSTIELYNVSKARNVCTRALEETGFIRANGGLESYAICSRLSELGL